MSFVTSHIIAHKFSILDGAVKPKDLLAQAAEYEMPALAITDTCNMYCAVDFIKQPKGSTSNRYLVQNYGYGQRV